MDDAKQPEDQPEALPPAPADGAVPAAPSHSLPIVEVRDDLVICQHGTRYAEVSRDELDHDVEPQPGDRVNFHEDGRREHVPVAPSAHEKVRRLPGLESLEIEGGVVKGPKQS